jgi:hypothetical protein
MKIHWTRGIREAHVHRTPLRIGIVVFTAFLCCAAVANSRAADPDVDEARKVAERWVALVDAGRYDESWNAAASYFRSQVSKTDWKNAATSARGPLGALASRTFNAAQATHDLPGVPHGDYIVLVYDGAFANRNVREIITPMREADGNWKVAGYVIQ